MSLDVHREDLRAAYLVVGLPKPINSVSSDHRIIKTRPKQFQRFVDIYICPLRDDLHGLSCLALVVPRDGFDKFCQSLRESGLAMFNRDELGHTYPFVSGQVMPKLPDQVFLFQVKFMGWRICHDNLGAN